MKTVATVGLCALVLIVGVLADDGLRAATARPIACEQPRSLPGGKAAALAVTPGCPPVEPEPPVVPQYAATIAGQSVPAIMVVGQPYTVSISATNTGRATWSGSDAYSLGSQNPGDNLTWGTHRVPVTGQVSKGQTATFNFTVTAPLSAGRYNFQWRMVRDGVAWFGGATPNVQVVVLGSQIRGNIDAVADGEIRGWACSSGVNSSIDVHLYLGGPAGQGGAMVGSYRADRVSEPQVATACVAGGQNYRFAIPIAGDWTTTHAGRPIHVYGISPVGAVNTAIPGSGSFRVPSNRPPSILLDTPAAGQIVQEGGEVAIGASASDPDDGVSAVTFFGDGTRLGQVGAAPWQFKWAGLPEGAHTVYAEARDTAGAVVSSETRTFYVSGVIGDIAQPGSTIWGWACSTFWGPSIKVHLYLGGSAGWGAFGGEYEANLATGPERAAACKANGTAYMFSIPVTDEMLTLHSGKSIYIHGISPVGGGNNLLGHSGSYTVPANQLPVVSLQSAQAGSQMNSPARVVLTANASDADDGLNSVVFLQNGSPIATLGAAPFTFQVDALASGKYRFVARATDRRGATADSNEVTVTVVKGQAPAGVSRRFVYDEYQQLCKIIEPETGATVMDYDAAGNLIWTASGLTLVDAASCNRQEAHTSGRRVDRSYDARNRLATVRFPDRNGDQDLSYTADGLKSHVTTLNESGLTAVLNTYQYNKRRLLIAETQTVGGETSKAIGYGYDGLGNLASIRYPSSYWVQYGNNALGQPTSVTGSDGQVLASAISYHPSGEVRALAYGNGITRTVALNARMLPAAIEASGVSSEAYTYDPNANVVSILDRIQGSQFDRTMEYDLHNRLSAAASPSFGGGHWYRYQYDSLDNILGVSLDGVKDHRYWYDDHNRLSNVMDAEGGTVVGLSYDVQGNLSRKNGQGYSFDLGNRLREVLGKERYLYGSGGMRAASVDAEGLRVLSQYGDSGALVYQERRGEGALEYVSANNSVIAIRKGGSVLYQHADALGSTVATTSSSGAVEERVAYEPYGASLGASIDGVGYAGHVMDGPTGLVYMEQRYYEPTLGRFLSIDPVGALKDPAAMFNRYKYGLNNPYKFVDLDGRAESPAWMRAVFPGQAHWDQGMTEIENGNYGRSALFVAGALTEGVVGIVTLGQSQRFAAPARSLLVAAEAGSIRNVNLIKGTTNCVNCAIATDATLAGRPASALNSGPTVLPVLESLYGRSFVGRSTIEGVSGTMSEAGHGARGIVFGDRGAGKVGHVFNVVNQSGAVRYLDGQSGKEAVTEGYKAYRLLRTDP